MRVDQPQDTRCSVYRSQVHTPKVIFAWALREILIQNSPVMMDEMMSAMTEDQLDLMMQREFLQQLLQYALIIVATLPVLAMYPFVQKYFVRGIMIGAIKG